MRVDILKEEDVNLQITHQISELFRQLSPHKKQMDLLQILGVRQTTVAYCRQNSNIVGLALMGTYHVISGYKAWIEDVVVDQNSRGQGIGRALMEKLLTTATKKGVTEVLLFTEDHRTPAINLYHSLGFELKDSKIYVLKTDSGNTY